MSIQTSQSSDPLTAAAAVHSSSRVPRPATSAIPLWRLLAPICVMVFVEFLAMGLPLPVLPLRVHEALGFGSFVVGLAIGA